MIKSLVRTSIVITILIGMVYSQISWSGDVLVRPRIDQKFSDGDKTSQDMYWLGWVRLNMKADIGGGYYAKALLSADGPGHFWGILGTSTWEEPGEYWDRNNPSPQLAFSELYVGRNADNFSFQIGKLNVNALANPAIDLQYYPSSGSDIPYFILARNTADGLRGSFNAGPGKLTASLLINSSVVNTSFDADGNEVTASDPYSVHVDYSAKFGGITIAPTFLMEMGVADSTTSPTTMGANFALPKIAGFGISGGVYMTSNNVEGSTEYSGNMIHVKAVGKAGPGVVIAWADIGNVSYTDVSDISTTYIWLMYKYTLYSGDRGSFFIAPIYRKIIKTTTPVEGDESEYSRNKIEMSIHMVFK